MSPEITREELAATVGEGKRRLLVLVESSRLISETKIVPRRAGKPRASPAILYRVLETADQIPFCLFVNDKNELLIESALINPYNSVCLLRKGRLVRGLVENIFVYYATRQAQLIKAGIVPFFGLDLYPALTAKHPGDRRTIQICVPHWSAVFSISTTGQLDFNLTTAGRKSPYATYSWTRDPSEDVISESLIAESIMGYHPKATYIPEEGGIFRMTDAADLRQEFVPLFPRQDLLRMFDFPDLEYTTFLLRNRVSPR